MSPFNLLDKRVCKDFYKKLAFFVVENQGFHKVWTTIQKFDFPIVFLIELIVAIGFHESNWLGEELWTIFQYIVSCILIFFIGTYKTIECDKCIFIQLHKVVCGFYNHQCQPKKNDDEEIYYPIVKHCLNKKKNDLTRMHLVALKILMTNELIEANLALAFSLIVEMPLVIAKLYFLYSGPIHPCSFRSALRALVMIIGIFGTIKAIVTQELLTMQYLKVLNFMDAFDSKDFSRFKASFQARTTIIMSTIFHGLGVCYHIYIITFCYALSFWIGQLNITILLFNSWINYKASRPVYENAPVGVKTRMYILLEILGGLLTFRNVRISTSNTSWQVYRTSYLLIAKIIEHIGLLYVFITLFELANPEFKFDEYAANFNIGVMNGITNSTSFSHDVYNFITYPFSLMTPKFCFCQGFLEITFRLNAIFLLYIVVSFVHFFYLDIGGLNDDQFPTYNPIHIWSEKFLKQNYSTVSNLWIIQMMLYTVASESTFQKIVEHNEAISEKTCMYYFLRQFDKLNTPPPSYDSIKMKFETIFEDNDRLYDVRAGMAQLVNYVYNVNTGVEQYLETHNLSNFMRRLCYQFCIHFENQMKLMDSRRMSKICQMLGSSPIIVSDFVDTDAEQEINCENPWFSYFK